MESPPAAPAATGDGADNCIKKAVSRISARLLFALQNCDKLLHGLAILVQAGGMGAFCRIADGQ